MNKQETERLAVLETKVNNIEMSQTRIEHKLDELTLMLNNNFARKSELNSLIKDVEGMAAARLSEKWIVRLLLACSLIINIVAIYELFGGKQ